MDSKSKQIKEELVILPKYLKFFWFYIYREGEWRGGRGDGYNAGTQEIHCITDFSF